MDQVIDKARQRLSLLETEAEQIRAFIHIYEQLAAEGEAQKTAHTESLATPANPPRGYVPRSSPGEIVAAAKGIIKVKQRPLTRSELVRLLTLRGLKIAGTDKSKNVGTIIWRSKQFENVKGKGYWPKEFGPWGESEFNF